MSPLYERVRPHDLDGVIGQPRGVAAARRLVKLGIGGRMVWITGPSGCGKTTIARILADSIADAFFAEESVGRDWTAAGIRDLAKTMRLTAWGKGGRVWIVNEAHGLSRPASEALNQLAEPLPPHVAMIFTTSRAGQESMFEDDGINVPMLLSRCDKINLTNQGMADAAAPWLRSVAQAENIDGQPVEAYVKLMRRHGNNLRAALQDIEAGCMVQPD